MPNLDIKKKTTSRPIELGYVPYAPIPLSQRTRRYSTRIFLLTLLFLIGTCLGFVALFFWASHDTLQESITGTGQMIPVSKISKVMSPVSATVKKVLVQENQLVHAGDILLEMDLEPNQVESNGILSQISLLEDDTNSLRKAALGQAGGTFSTTRGEWLSANQETVNSQNMEAMMQIDKAQHDYQQWVEKEKNLEKILAESEEELLKYQTLYQQESISEKELKEYEMRVIQTRGDVATTKEAMASAKIAAEQAKQRPIQVNHSYKRDYLEKISDNERRIADLENMLQKNHLDKRYRYITAPIDGYINQQAVHGTGEVINAGELLFSIVPSQNDLVAEIHLPNKDLAYVHSGQRVMLKLDAFPYQHFSKLYGTIIAMSPSSQQPDSPMIGPKGPEAQAFYAVQVKPDATYLLGKDKKYYDIRSGMTVSADFITQQKRLIDFFLEPFAMNMDKAFKDPSSR